MEGMRQGRDRLDLCLRIILPEDSRGSNVDVERAGETAVVETEGGADGPQSIAL